MGFIDANRRNDKDPEYILNECLNVTKMGIQMLGKIEETR